MHIPSVLFLESNRVWRTYPGGKKLDIMEGKACPEDAHFPEDWIGSTTRAVNKGREHLTEEKLSKVTVDGETLTLKALCEQEPDALLGAGHVATYGANTRFLMKFPDSAIRLHIQCHPTIPFAQKHLNSNAGKTEVYVILSIRGEVKESYIYMGFQHPPEKAEFKRMIEEQDTDAILACFEKIPIKPGLVDDKKTPCFSVNRIAVKDRFTKQVDSFYVGIVAKGAGTIIIGDETHQVEEGEKFFVLYQTGAVTFESDADMGIVATFPPE